MAKTKAKKRLARPRMQRRAHALCGPVGKAVALQAARLETLNIGLACLVAEHGTEQRKLLASLAYMIGIGAEVAAVVQVEGDNRAGLHQALQEVVRMAIDGARWDAAWAAQLQLALEISQTLMLEHAARAIEVTPGARGLSDDVLAGRVRADVLQPLCWPEA